MRDLLAVAIGLPAVVFGVLFHNGAEVTLGLLALGMAGVAQLAWMLRRDWRKNRDVVRGRRSW